jgi:hypothetical protein
MASSALDLVRKVAELRVRFPEADRDVVELALNMAKGDLSAAAQVLIGFGSKEVASAPVQPRALQAAAPPPIPRSLFAAQPLPPPPVAAPPLPPPPVASQPLSRPPVAAAPQPLSRHPSQRSSVFDGFDPSFVERAMAQAKGDEHAAIEVSVALL